ncbi:cobaltochelatase subunit CobN [Acaryochloris sp. IP29b_bin.148]|uniref:cobaltochelatase subunit CobN n=1 Tax=Acaryochloris sp. IP29b_bin.148 TaxID=2969218 RepID=UPI00261E6761|nr:cobaltochelatase subunit CobN [Acaryochloris sp. IP29b_bin.148]
MHRLAAMPGGWESGSAEGVIFVEQTPAPIAILTAADTDIQVLAQTLPLLSKQVPPIRVANLLHLQQQLSIDHYAETVLCHAQVIIVRLLGGRAYWSYGLEVLKDCIATTGAALYVMPGDDRPDPDLVSHSSVGLSAVHQLWQYFTEGGVHNGEQALRFIAHHHFGATGVPAPPQAVPRIGLFASGAPTGELSKPRVGILFYRSHYLAGNGAAIAALSQALHQRHLTPVPIFVQSLQDPDVQAELVQLLNPPDQPGIDLLLNTTSFSLAKLAAETLNLKLWQQLDVPVLQVICSGGTVERWQTHLQGLAPRDMAMNVALPEVDGRIISRAVSFKAVQTYHAQLETDVVSYQPVADRIQFVAALTANWVKLRHCPPSDRRVALILANYPSRDGRLANGVGLDTPASCVAILRAMAAEGYRIGPYPEDSDQLMERLTTGVTNDPEGWPLRRVEQKLSLAEYEAAFAQLPAAVQQQLCDRWGTPRQAAPEGFFAIAGMQLGHVFVGIQPARGYDLDPSLNYHAPDLEPTHRYLAFYIWLRQQFQVQAVIHVGKHGNLEWLPGKSIALSDTCYPEIALGPLPHLYPFIVNDPGEGAQAKRRGQAVILDHLTPPLTRAELYGPLQKLAALIDEYYDAQSLDPSRLPVIRDRILALIQSEQLDQDLGLAFSNEDPTGLEALLTQADGYLCELKEAQIRDGLHIFGACPEQIQLRDLVVSLARQPSPHHQGLTRTLAQAWQLNLDPLTVDPAQPLTSHQQRVLNHKSTALHIAGDAIAVLETEAAALVEQLLAPTPVDLSQYAAALQAELGWIRDSLLPRLYQTDQEITHLLQGLDGRYVPSGASGAPTRGRPDVLPTGRNFYSVDIRALPTESAWDVGRKAAEVLVERYTQDHGEYPRTLGLSMWGTATMRTGGDDLAQALALLGVQPVWDGLSRRVIDFEILPLSILGRPRVDVTLRISGFFRDAFPNLIDLFDRAVNAVASLDESGDDNPLRSHVQQEQQFWLNEGLAEEKARGRSRYRIFGSKPGAYGAGLQGLIESQHWTDDQDLARAYMNWSSYAYTAASPNSPSGASEQFAPEAFSQRLRQMQIVLHNQDNREHDLLDSDDYYQFQGGLATAVRAVQGHNPELYFGDHAIPSHPKVRKLQEEIARVYRSRVVNPKWIAGVMRHGYKGAFEMTATVDYLFAYDATTHCVADHMYQGVATSYLFNPQVQEFIQAKNPWALRDMAERLLEAHQRGLWQQVDPETLEQLRSLVNQAEGVIETQSSPPM